MTPESEKKVQTKVGIFVLIGLLVAASMVTYFGRLGEGLKRYYALRVEYENASGLLGGANVLMSGAKVGRTATGPQILPGLDGVYVDLKIYDYVKIPEGSVFTIGSSGLLGDRFVNIELPPNARERAPIGPDATVKGKRESGISEFMEQGGDVVAEVKEVLQKINVVISRLDAELLKSDTLKDLGDSIANLKTTTATLAESSKKVNGILDSTGGKLDGLMTDASATMKSARATADELKGAVADAQTVIQNVKRGRGALGMLLSNQEFADNLRNFVANLRQSGVLFYRDRSQRREN
ncbi:MAG TPA: MlaD family protein [Chthoniobacterales bacterium]